jgi:hypothetical protein
MLDFIWGCRGGEVHDGVAEVVILRNLTKESVSQTSSDAPYLITRRLKFLGYI